METTTTLTGPTPGTASEHGSAITPGSVVVGVDGSDHAADAVAWAAEQAVLDGRRLTLLHAADPLSTTTSLWLTSVAIDPAEVRRDVEAAGHALLDRTAATVRSAHPGLDVRTAMRLADPREALLQASATADLVVVGSRGHGPVGSLLLGSVSVAVARHADSPVVVVRPTQDADDEERHGVLVGIDGTERSLPALEAAYRQASARRLPLTVVHCTWDVLAAVNPAHLVGPDDRTVDDARVLMAESVSGMGEEFPDVEVRLELARGLAEEVLGRESHERDLVVVGHHRAGAITSTLRGSVATTVLEHAACPVLVVPDHVGRR